MNAKLHGAKAVLIVNDLPNHTGNNDELMRFEPLMATEDYGILVDQISVQAWRSCLPSQKRTCET